MGGGGLEKLSLVAVEATAVAHLAQLSELRNLTYLEPGGTSLQAGEVGGKNTGLVELTRAHEAIKRRLSA